MKGFMHNSMGSLLNIFGIWMRKAFKWVEAVEGEKKVLLSQKIKP